MTFVDDITIPQTLRCLVISTDLISPSCLTFLLMIPSFLNLLHTVFVSCETLTRRFGQHEPITYLDQLQQKHFHVLKRRFFMCKVQFRSKYNISNLQCWPIKCIEAGACLLAPYFRLSGHHHRCHRVPQSRIDIRKSTI